jgi:predicted ArsR family transcriptional regulator
MNTKDMIYQFCKTPKTAAQIAEHTGLTLPGVYTQLSSLQRAKLIDKHGDGKRRSMPATFVHSRHAPKVTENTETYENLAITRAHNPFNLKGAK